MERFVRKLVAAAFLGVSLGQGWAQQKSIDLRQASQYFAEMKAASDRDSGHLWKHSLDGPMLFVDPDTQFAVANQRDGQGKLTPQGDAFIGTVPPDLGVANTSLNWAGVTWTLVTWPLPEHRRDRVRLMAHECFHRIEPQLGIQPAGDVLNSQLDTRDGRTWLQLEFRALERAVWANGLERRDAIADALYFRAHRRALFPGSGPREDALEMNEGLAEYTGVMLAAQSAGEAMSLAEVTLQLAPQRSSFVRTFAYVTGPAYGYLLDQSGQSWRPKLQASSDLSQILAAAYRIENSPVTQSEAIRRAQSYDGDEIIALENNREATRKKLVADATARLIDGPVLILPLSPDVQYTFDPNTVLAIDDNSALYPTAQVTDEWGTLRVENGALLVRDNGRPVRAQVPAPAGANLREGDGWKLDFKPGWKVEKGQRPGDWIVVKMPAA
jgi:hypothetical protein